MTDGRPLARLRQVNPAQVRQWAKRTALTAMARSGYRVTRLGPGERRYLEPSHSPASLPSGAEQYLRPDNPRLLELEAAYDALDIPATSHTQWRKSFLKKNLSMAWFRGDNAYVWQLRYLGDAAETRMYLSMLDVASRDDLKLLDRLEEDGLFGCWTFQYGDRLPVSRDLVDSVNEINYLDDLMGLSTIEDLKVLDIGAGYGRLAHRMSAALPNLSAYDCTDGVATSTFLCEYYTGFRELPGSVRVVPLHEHETLLDEYDLAVNIHSFSECSLDAIRWWLDRIAERRVEWLLIVPNRPPEQLLSTELDGRHLDFAPYVEAAGYERVDCRPRHQDDELRRLIGVDGRFHLFRRKQD